MKLILLHNTREDVIPRDLTQHNVTKIIRNQNESNRTFLSCDMKMSGDAYILTSPGRLLRAGRRCVQLF